MSTDKKVKSGVLKNYLKIYILLKKTVILKQNCSKNGEKAHKNLLYFTRE
jgi:hypothetical protein